MGPLLPGKDTLKRAGFVHVPPNQMEGRYEGEKAIVRCNGWYVGPSGQFAYVKEVQKDEAAGEYLASRLAVRANIPCPQIELIKIAHPKDLSGWPCAKTGYAVVSPTLGETQQSLRHYMDKEHDAGSLKTVSESLSYSLPFATFMRHDDLYPRNVAVSSWHDGDGNKVTASYIIDYAFLNFDMRRAVDTRNLIEKKYRKLICIDKAMYQLGVEAVENISDSCIRRHVEKTFRACSIDLSQGVGDIPPCAEAVEALISSREKVARVPTLSALRMFAEALRHGRPETSSPTLPPASVPVVRRPACAA